MFDVYVDGATGTSHDAVHELAETMAVRYGVPAAELQARLMRGRFCVRSDVDRATAEAYLRDLAAIGARVWIAPAATESDAVPGRGATGAAAATRAPPQPEGRAVRSSVPPGAQSTRSSLPPPEGRRVSSSPASEAGPRSTRSSLPPQPEGRPAGSSLSREAGTRSTQSSLPPQPEGGPGGSSLSREAGPRSTRSSLPPQPEGRPVGSSLSREAGTRSSLPPQPEGSPGSSSPASEAGPRLTRSSLPPQPEGRTAGSSLSPGTDARSTPPPPPEGGPMGVSPGPPPWRSLDAGSPEEAPTSDEAAGLGALDRGGLLSLGTLDDEPAGMSPFDRAMPAIDSGARAPARSPRARPASLDRFAPPEQATTEAVTEAMTEAVLELADDTPPHRARPRSSEPLEAASALEGPPSPPPEPAPAPWSASLQAASRAPGRSGSPRMAPESALGGDFQRPRTPVTEPGRCLEEGAAEPRALASRMQEGLSSLPDARSPRGLAARYPMLRSLRARFAAGVALAILLGFIPAHVVAAMRERSAFRAIDGSVTAVQAAADTPESYAALDAFRAEQLDAKRSAHRAIVWTSLLIWGAAGGGLAYVWFRRLPWDRLG